MSFNPSEHISKIKGKDYLEAKWRIVWFREEHPDWGIETSLLEHDKGKYAVVKAIVRNPEGREIGHGTKMEDVQGFADYLEKAETGAISRALAMCGYGTQFAQEFEEGNDVADSPVNPPAGSAPPAAPAAPAASQNGNGAAQALQDTYNELRHELFPGNAAALKAYLDEKVGTVTRENLPDAIDALRLLKKQREAGVTG